MTFWQTFARPVPSLNPYAPSDPALFICSSSTPPGGGVHGMCGFAAAQLARKRLV
jgi:phytoene dehydrogenase-like protein